MTHLTPEEFEAQLHTPQPHPHLAACEPCRHELTQMQATFANLRLSLTALAEAPPVHRQPAAPRTWAWVLATACALLTAAAVPAYIHTHRSTTPAQSVNTDQEDEALLQGIHHDLSTAIAPSLRPLAIEPQSRQ